MMTRRQARGDLTTPMTVYGLHAMKTKSDEIRPPMTTPLTTMASVPINLDQPDTDSNRPDHPSDLSNTLHPLATKHMGHSDKWHETHLS